MTLSSTATASALAHETGEVWLMLAEIDHPALRTPARIVNNPTNIISNGNTFISLPFSINLPSDNDSTPEITMKIDNVDRSINDIIQSIPAGNPPTCKILIVLASQPNTVEVEFDATLKSIDCDVTEVSAIFGPEDILNEPYPGDYFVPSQYPSLFSYLIIFFSSGVLFA